MNEVGFSRFYICESDQDDYAAIKEGQSSVLSDFGQIFLLAACVGYKYDKREPIVKGEKRERVLYDAFFGKAHAKEIYGAFKQIAIKNQEFDDEGNLKVNTLIEEYANGGFQMLKESIKNRDKVNSELINFILLNFENEQE